MFLPQPLVIGVRMTGSLPPGTTATDLVLTLTQMLRAHGVVGSFVEFFGDGLSTLSTADRATLSNMCPEYGATASYFPVDAETLRYLSFTGRGALVDVVERYTKEQGLFRSDGDPDPVFTEVLDLDLSSVVPSLAGPKRPQDRVALPDVWSSFAVGVRRSTRRAAERAPRRLGRDRRDHQLHEHVEPVGDGRRRPAGEEGGRGRTPGEAVGEDVPGARVRGS